MFKDTFLSHCFVLLAGVLTSTGAYAHSYQTCMEFHLQDCQVSAAEDPLGNCQAQADAFCFNHGHGGGVGFDPLGEPVFAIEDKDDLLVIEIKLPVGGMTKDRKRWLIGVIERNAKIRALQHQIRNERYKLLDQSEADK